MDYPVIIEAIPVWTLQEDLYKLFNKFGTVTRINYHKGPTGRFDGIATIYYKEKMSAARVLRFKNPIYYKRFALNVRQPQELPHYEERPLPPSPPPPPPRDLYDDYAYDRDYQEYAPRRHDPLDDYKAPDDILIRPPPPLQPRPLIQVAPTQLPLAFAAAPPQNIVQHMLIPQIIPQVAQIQQIPQIQIAQNQQIQLLQQLALARAGQQGPILTNGVVQNDGILPEMKYYEKVISLIKQEVDGGMKQDNRSVEIDDHGLPHLVHATNPIL